MNTNDREASIGALILLAGALVLAVAYGGVNHRSSVEGYDLKARFNRAEGITVGSDVRLSGISIGKVTEQTLDERYKAVLTLRLSRSVKLPSDSAALIYTDGLLGGKYVSLQPGGEETDLGPGQEFMFTQDSVNVPDLLEMIIAQGKAKRAERAAQPAQP